MSGWLVHCIARNFHTNWIGCYRTSHLLRKDSGAHHPLVRTTVNIPTEILLVPHGHAFGVQEGILLLIKFYCGE